MKGDFFMGNYNPYARTRNFKQIVYPESAPQNWIDLIKAEIEKGEIEWATISPLHDKDRYTKLEETEASAILAGTVDKETISSDTARLMQEIYVGMSIRAGELKKPHYHFDCGFKNPRYHNSTNEYLKSLTNGTNIIAMENLRGSVRYHAHLDEDPREKAFYNPEEIIVLGNIKIDRYLDDEDKSMSTLMAWYVIEDLINEHNVTNMCQFDRLMRSQDVDLQQQVMNNQNLRNRVRDHVRDKRSYVEQDLKAELMKNKRFEIKDASLTKREKELERKQDSHERKVKSDLAEIDRQRAYLEDLEEHFKKTSA